MFRAVRGSRNESVPSSDEVQTPPAVIVNVVLESGKVI